MKRLVLFSSILLILLTACQAAPTSTPTPAPPTDTPIPPTATPLPFGIIGSVQYTGNSQGGLFVQVMDQPPAEGENPNPAQVSVFDTTSGEFMWELPPGTYYIVAFLTIDREPQGPPLPNEPVVSCDPIQLGADQTLTVQIDLNDSDMGGQTKSCVVP
ncbi:MAG: hypothetical protein M1347_07600 [Chloroflexi bacterium]|nr:hypothetical protein [Chloroflexota bacterium]